MNRLREEVLHYQSVSVAGFVFQACSFDHSDISPSLESTSCERLEESIAKRSFRSYCSTMACRFSGLRTAVTTTSRQIVSDLLMSSDHLRAVLMAEHFEVLRLAALGGLRGVERHRACWPLVWRLLRAVHHRRRRQARGFEERREVDAVLNCDRIPASNSGPLVLFDNQTRSMLQADQPFPSISSQR